MVHVINKQSCKDKVLLRLIMRLVLFCLNVIYYLRQTYRRKTDFDRRSIVTFSDPGSSGVSPLSGPSANVHSRDVVNDLSPVANRILTASLNQTTRKAYK